MDTERDMAHVEPFKPLGPAPRKRLILAVAIAPALWLIAVATVAITVDRTDAIGLGVVIAGSSAVVAAVVLALLRAGREREKARYEPRR